MNLYLSKCFQNEGNTDYHNRKEITCLEDLKEAARVDHMFSEVTNGIRKQGRDNFIGSDCNVFDVDNSHSEDPDLWIEPDDISDVFGNDLRYYVIFSRNHMREKKKDSGESEGPRPRFHIYCPRSKKITNYDSYADFATKVLLFFPFFDKKVIERPTQFIFGVADPKGDCVDGAYTIDQVMAEKTDEEIEAAGKAWLESIREQSDRYDPYWIEKIERLYGASQAEQNEVIDPKVDIEVRDDQAKFVQEWCAKHNVEIKKTGTYHSTDHQHAVILFLGKCPWEEEHTVSGKDDVKIIIDAGPVPGRINFKCEHDHCSGRSWEDFRSFYDERYRQRVIARSVHLRMVPTNKKDSRGQLIFKPVQSADNIATVLREDPELAGRIRFDTFAYRPRYTDRLPWRRENERWGEWEDSDDSHLRARMQSMYGLKGKDIYYDGMNIVLFENRFSPIVDLLEGLPPWDGQERIANLLPDFLGAEKTDYNTGVLKLFMQEALSRVYRPGCKADYVPVLVGKQGIGKSKFGEMLAINQIWYDGNFNTLDGKEAAERLRGKWILELAELLAMKKAREVEAVKSFITTNVDSFRAPYGHRTTDHPRQCVFFATTNEDSFLTDRTGNRRFLPVKCGINQPTKDLFSADADSEFFKAWAQALHEFKAAGERPSLVLPPELLADAEDEQTKHLQEDPRVGIIQAYLDKSISNKVCVMELWQKALKEQGTPSRPVSSQLHSIMRNDINGWEPAGQQRFDGYGQQRAYKRIESMPDGFEVNREDVPF